ELAMIGKTLLNLDEIGLTLAPRFDANAAIRRHAADITQEQMVRDVSLASFFSTAVELKNFVQHLPGRINRILDRLADNEFAVKVNALDETRLMAAAGDVLARVGPETRAPVERDRFPEHRRGLEHHAPIPAVARRADQLGQQAPAISLAARVGQEVHLADLGLAG